MKNILINLNKYWATPLLAIVSALMAIYISLEQNRTQKASLRIDSLQKTFEKDLRIKEFEKTLRLELFSEVKSALKENNDDSYKAVLSVIDIMLSEDTVFRNKLSLLIYNSYNTSSSIKSIISDKYEKENEYNKEEKENFEKDKITMFNSKKSKFRVDLFYLENELDTLKEKAELLKKLIEQNNNNEYDVNIRLLPRSINARLGYGIVSNEIRHEKDTFENSKAEEILNMINKSSEFKSNKFSMKEINPNRKTPNYISIFIAH